MQDAPMDDQIHGSPAGSPAYVDETEGAAENLRPDEEATEARGTDTAPEITEQ